MKDLKLFLGQLGGLHDAVVHELSWKPESRTIRLEIQDLCRNFEGLSEYPGAVSGSIELHDVEEVSLDIKTDEKRLNIHEFSVETHNSGKSQASVSFWPTGRMTALYRNADFPQVTLRKVKS